MSVPFDIIVLGGGIHGCGVARDAALRGLRVALFEKHDFGAGTSSASSKLVHGGLRYLEQWRFGLVRESLRERATLLKTAPHLVRPLPFLLPLYEGAARPKWMLRAGLTLYDLLAAGHNIERHKWLPAEEALRREPRLRAEGLQGAFLYHDAQMDDARLCLENALGAVRCGAMVRNRHEAVDLLVHEGQVRGVRVRDLETQTVHDVESHLVVDTTGPWYGELEQKQSLAHTRRPRLSRGTHVVVPRVTQGHGLLLTAKRDGRVFFVLPFKGQTMIGTTDLDHHEGPDHVEPTPAEVDYLLEESRRVLGDEGLAQGDVLHRFAGVRALTPDEEADVGTVSREADLREEAPGLLGVLGGKYTTYRAVAERVVERVFDRLERPAPECVTATRPLPGGDVPDMNEYFAVAEDLLVKRYDQLEPPTLRALLGMYGSRHTEVLELLDADPEGADPVEFGLPFVKAQLEHAIRHEMARDVEDVVRRRTYRAYLGGWDDEARSLWNAAFDRAMGRVHAPL